MAERSPELSNARSSLLTGDEPILSGMYSQVLLDRRSAYTANNMYALIKTMTQQQRFRYKHWCAGVALRKAEAVYLLYQQQIPDDTWLRGMLAAIQRWQNHPVEKHLPAAISISGPSRGKNEAYFADMAVRHTYCIVMAQVYGTEKQSRKVTLQVSQRCTFGILSAQLARIGQPTNITADKPISEAFGAYLAETTARIERAQIRAAYIILQRGDHQLRMEQQSLPSV